MADLLTSTINGNLYMNGTICLNSSDTACVITRNGIPSGLTIGPALKSLVNVSNSINFIGGTSTSPSGIGMTGNRLVMWAPNGEIRGFKGDNGIETFRIDNKGRYYCLATELSADYGTTSTESKIKFNIAKASRGDSATTVAYVSANRGKALDTSSSALSKAANVNLSVFSMSPLSNGMLLITGSWALDSRSAIRDNTWFSINLPTSMTIYSAVVSDLDYNASGNGNAWFVASNSIGKPTNVLYVCKDTGNTGTNGFSFMAVAKLTDQSQLPGLFK